MRLYAQPETTAITSSFTLSPPPCLEPRPARKPAPVYVASHQEVAKDQNAAVVYLDRTTVERRLTADDVASVPFTEQDLDGMVSEILARLNEQDLDDAALPEQLRLDRIVRLIQRELFSRYGSDDRYPRICDVATAVGQRVLEQSGVETRSMWTRDLHHFLEVGGSDPLVVDFTQAQFDVTPLSRFAHSIVLARVQIGAGERPDIERLRTELATIDFASLTDVERDATNALLKDLVKAVICP